tara:strand:+ start:532 stop:645 length:114 start_codon:yes stop_codon:yes gene_type:complete
VIGGGDGNAREYESREETVKSVLVEKGKSFTPEQKYE